MWGDDAALGPEICLDTVGTGCPSVTVAHSDIEGGQQGAWVGNCSLTWEEGNIDADPLFADPDGPDVDPGTWEDNDHHLSAGSPCIDAADNNAVPPGVTTDLDGNPRFVDDPGTPDCPHAPGTCGTPPIVDMGAYEHQPVIPAVSEWGMVAMTLLLLMAGTLVFPRRRTVQM
jgi:hypothetical protein